MDNHIRTIHVDTNERIETGALRFVYENKSKEWPGLFLRGDDSFHLALCINYLTAKMEEHWPVLKEIKNWSNLSPEEREKYKPEEVNEAFLFYLNCLGPLQGIRETILNEVVVKNVDNQRSTTPSGSDRRAEPKSDGEISGSNA